MGRVSEEVKQVARERLIWAAAEAFAEVGVDRARIGDISLAAGLGKGTVYNYFESKEDLMLGIIEYFADRANSTAPEVTDEPVDVQLERILAADLEWVKEHEPFAKLYLQELVRADPGVYAKIIEASLPYGLRVVRILKAGAARGEVRRDVTPERLALTFAGLREMAMLQSWGTGWPTYDEIPKLVTSLFFHGAVGPDGGSGSRQL